MPLIIEKLQNFSKIKKLIRGSPLRDVSLEVILGENFWSFLEFFGDFIHGLEIIYHYAIFLYFWLFLEFWYFKNSSEIFSDFWKFEIFLEVFGDFINCLGFLLLLLQFCRILAIAILPKNFRISSFFLRFLIFLTFSWLFSDFDISFGILGIFGIFVSKIGNWKFSIFQK